MYLRSIFMEPNESQYVIFSYVVLGHRPQLPSGSSTVLRAIEESCPRKFNIFSDSTFGKHFVRLLYCRLPFNVSKVNIHGTE